jgi:hypothetical protein
MELVSWDWANYYQGLIQAGNPNVSQGCGSYAYQDLYIDNCNGNNLDPDFEYAFGGQMGSFVYYYGTYWAVEAYRENGNGDVWVLQYLD